MSLGRRPSGTMPSIQSVKSDIIRHREGGTKPDYAVGHRCADFSPDFLLPFSRLITVRPGGQVWGSFLQVKGDIDG